MEVEKQVLWKQWKNEYSILTGVLRLAKQEEYLLAAVVFFFSMVFPRGEIDRAGQARPVGPRPTARTKWGDPHSTLTQIGPSFIIPPCVEFLTL
jgi:hypothetical protein